MAKRKSAIEKPQGFWDDIVYPIAKKVTQKAVSSGKMKNTTRVKINRSIQDKAVSNKLKMSKSMIEADRAGRRGANALEKSVRNVTTKQKMKNVDPVRWGAKTRTVSAKKEGIIAGSRSRKQSLYGTNVSRTAQVRKDMAAKEAYVQSLKKKGKSSSSAGKKTK